jgi:hypothetical protein
MARYRRGRISRGDGLAAAAVSVAIGTGAALVTWYVTRLLLSREELPAGRLRPGGARALAAPESPELSSDPGG